MPIAVTVYLIGVWFCVGFFTSLGWALGTTLVARAMSRITP